MKIKLMRMTALRQALILTSIFIIILMLFGILVNVLLPHGVNKSIDQSLLTQANAIKLELNKPSVNRDSILSNPQLLEFAIGFKANNTAEIYGELRPGVFRSLGLKTLDEHKLFSRLDLTHQNLRQDALFSHSDNDPGFQHDWRVNVIEVAGGRLAIASPLDSVEQFQSVLTRSLLATGALMALITLIGGVLFGHLSQKRISIFEQKLKQIAQGDLSVRLAPKSITDDIDQLALNIDETTEKLSQLIAEVQNLSVNLAHELRTPLARLQASLEHSLSKSEPGVSDIEDALLETEAIAAIFETIMRISKINATVSKEAFRPIDLRELATEIAEIFEPVVESQGRNLKLSITNPLTIAADKSALIQAVGNLLQNALTYSPAKTPISICVETDSLRVIDHGPGIAETERQNVLKPMYRIDQARSSHGAGLGLALVKAIADLHSAQIILSDTFTKAPHGLTVTLQFTHRQ